ncbi:protein phosphatase 2C domain-containing protein [Ruminococcus sp.]|uniref:PP2C family protein-serine/threonine phosphatase n=1 Tax=Ruminococcus sp. TaxID=41978 RepID=UPI001B049DA7|nr:protein phosphatase 2C domain-containing protein [Ruminococcus sp.]MBO5559094.1 serine/threonine-protein phosphatase [Ruminococcus sp.]
MNGESRLQISVATHNGAVRASNEDNISINGRSRPIPQNIMNICGTTANRCLLLAVYDGMGGEQMGEVASDIAAKMSGKLLDRLNTAEVEKYPDMVNKYIDEANAEICRRLHNSGSTRGGTTAAIAYIKDGVVYPFSLGDSRIYLLVNGELIQISEDHTLAMRKYKANIYTLEEAEQSMDSHKLTLFLGVDVDGKGLTAQWYQPFNMPHSGKLLICSDGLYDMCSKDEIRDILLNSSEKNISSELVSAAVQNGGTDNITCIVMEAI